MNWPAVITELRRKADLHRAEIHPGVNAQIQMASGIIAATLGGIADSLEKGLPPPEPTYRVRVEVKP